MVSQEPNVNVVYFIGEELRQEQHVEILSN
jgi:hypothetical protein